MDCPGGSVLKNPPPKQKTQVFHPWVEKNPWRRKWQPTSVFLPVKSHGQKSLVGYSPDSHKRFKTRLSNETPPLIYTYTCIYLPILKCFNYFFLTESLQES